MTKKDLLKYISAFVMGDAGVYYSGINCRLITNSIQESYTDWKIGILQNLTEVNKHCAMDKRGDRQPLFVATTRAHPIYTKVREQVYVNSYRSVSPHYLKLLDWETLAILYMDDGSAHIDSRCDATPSVRLNTKRLSYFDSLAVKKAIKERLGLEFNVHSHYHRWFLTLRSRDYSNFKNNIKDFVLPCFQYKLP